MDLSFFLWDRNEMEGQGLTKGRMGEEPTKGE